MYKMIKNLVKGQTIEFNYGDKEYVLGVHSVTDIETYMHIREVSKYGLNICMNVDKLSKDIIWLYDFNMMGNRSNGRMYMSNITDAVMVDIVPPTTV